VSVGSKNIEIYWQEIQNVVVKESHQTSINKTRKFQAIGEAKPGAFFGVIL
jgi:hypothetical protein